MWSKEPPEGREVWWCGRHGKTAGDWIARHRGDLARLDAVHTEVLEKFNKLRERAERAEEMLRHEQVRRLKAEKRLKESMPRV